MIKRLLLVALVVCVSISALMAQQNRLVTEEQLTKFKESTLYVVYDESSLAYNAAVKGAVEKYWKLTPYKFVKTSEFETMLKKPNSVFLLMTRTTMTKDKRQIEYQYINLLMGDKVSVVNDLPEILTLPLAYTGTDDNAFAGKIPLIVRFAQLHVQNMISNQKVKPWIKLNKYNDNIEQIKTKTLLVAKEDLGEDANTEALIKASYPYNFKIVSADDVQKAIDEETPNTLVLHLVNPGEDGAFGRSYKMIFGTDDGQMYFYYFLSIYSRQPSGFMARDFKRISGKW